jgi:hypothetical protein
MMQFNLLPQGFHFIQLHCMEGFAASGCVFDGPEAQFELGVGTAQRQGAR